MTRMKIVQTLHRLRIRGPFGELVQSLHEFPLPCRAPIVLACLAPAFIVPLPAAAQAPVPTPEVRGFTLERDTRETLLLGFAADLPGSGGRTRIGAYVACQRGDATLEAGLYFGGFPAGRPVQAAVRAASGKIERFGPVVRGGPRSGFHSPRIRNRAAALRFLRAGFATGALISNGHNSVWNRIPAAENARARKRLLACAGAPEGGK